MEDKKDELQKTTVFPAVWQSDEMERERIKLQSILPEDVWYLVFDQDTELAENFWNSSLYLRSLSHSKRTVLLFPKVWEILAKKYGWKYFCQGPINKPITQCDSCSRYNYSRYSGIFAIRSVCKGWAKTIDNSGILPRRHILDHDVVTKNKIYCVFSSSDERKDNTAQKFLDHFEPTHGNRKNSRSPFLGNSLKVSYKGYDHDESDRIFFEKITEIISKYGHHVCRLAIVETVRMMYLAGYIKLTKLLRAMPNLETLEITHFMSIENQTRHPVPMYKQGVRLIDYMASNPLPKLKNLQAIKIAGNGSVFSILYELIQINNHISKLEIRNLSIAKCDILATPLPNLRELSVELYSEDDVQALEDTRLNWPLTKLVVGAVKRNVQFESVYSVLQRKWSGARTELLWIDKSTSLRLENFTRLHLTSFLYTSLDLLLPLKANLRDLFVTDESDYKEHKMMNIIGNAIEDNAIIKFWSNSGKPLKSNIWMHFPKLKKVQYCRKFGTSKSCTREDWSLQQNTILSVN